MGLAVGLDRNENTKEATAFTKKMMLSNKMAVIATFTDPGTADTHTATIDWGDGTPAETATVTQGAGSGSVSSATDHVYADNGDYTVTTTVTDDDGCSNSDTLIITVNNVPPVVTAPDDTPIVFGESVSSSVYITDPPVTSLWHV